jgi:hypothetical protein
MNSNWPIKTFEMARNEEMFLTDANSVRFVLHEVRSTMYIIMRRAISVAQLWALAPFRHPYKQIAVPSPT